MMDAGDVQAQTHCEYGIFKVRTRVLQSLLQEELCMRVELP